jgi:hypothetical protein
MHDRRRGPDPRPALTAQEIDRPRTPAPRSAPPAVFATPSTRTPPSQSARSSCFASGARYADPARSPVHGRAFISREVSPPNPTGPLVLARSTTERLVSYGGLTASTLRMEATIRHGSIGPQIALLIPRGWTGRPRLVQLSEEATTRTSRPRRVLLSEACDSRRVEPFAECGGQSEHGPLAAVRRSEDAPFAVELWSTAVPCS